jgi:hypothetical protein
MTLAALLTLPAVKDQAAVPGRVKEEPKEEDEEAALAREYEWFH